jgi:hypothetical protein
VLSGGVSTIGPVSGGDLAATLAVAFVGGGLGAILGPVITARYESRRHLAQRRDAPYAEILRTAFNLLRSFNAVFWMEGTAKAKTATWADAHFAFYEAAVQAQHVMSEEVAALVDQLIEVSVTYMSVGRSPHQGEERLEDTNALTDRAEATYDALRKQVQTETRGVGPDFTCIGIRHR